MEIELCEKCGKMFKSVANEKFCMKCELEIKEKGREVQKYFEDNADGTLEGAAEHCGIEQKFIKRWLKEGTLRSEQPLLSCEGCRAAIFTGKLCNDCKKRCYDLMGEIKKNKVL